MRHRVEGRKLKRTASHRKALLQTLTTSLIRHKRIKTTEAKAKEASRFAEAIITRAKRAHLAEQAGAVPDVHARRMVGRDIHDNAVLRELFTEVAPKVANRPGGYTRVVKLGVRLGDGARIAILELVDYNMERDDSAARSRSKNAISRAERVARSRAKQAKTATPAETPKAAAPAEEAPVAAAAPVEEAPAAEAAPETTHDTAATDAPSEPTGDVDAGNESEGNPA
ncbi:MAG: rplQ [Chlorobi bacterium]|nr:rplQ [Chlorobiota bacterium]